MKKYFMLVSVIFTFLIVSVSFAQLGDIPINMKGDFTMEEKKASIMALKEVVGKLSKGMLKDEVLQQVGKPTYSFDTNVYYSRKTNTLRLNFFDDKLSIAVAKDGFDLLAKEVWEAKVLSFPVLINEEEPLTSNPVVTISNKVYVPIEDLAEQLGITTK